MKDNGGKGDGQLLYDPTHLPRAPGLVVPMFTEVAKSGEKRHAGRSKVIF